MKHKYYRRGARTSVEADLTRLRTLREAVTVTDAFCGEVIPLQVRWQDKIVHYSQRMRFWLSEAILEAEQEAER